MGNECVGSLAPQADLLGFAVAIVLSASMGLLLTEGYGTDERCGTMTVSTEDVRAILEWPGFDPDGDGVLSPPGSGLGPSLPVTNTRGDLVAVLSKEGWEGAYLFRDGSFEGDAQGLSPASLVRSVNVMIMREGSAGPGTLSIFRTEMDI